ncbi:hypothetical protein RFI_20886, partial [Reticulomyxa filosa]
MKAVDSKKTPSLYYRDFTITKNVSSSVRVGMYTGKIREIANYSFSHDRSACLIQKKKGFFDFSQQNCNDTQRGHSIFFHLLSSISASANDFEFVSSAYNDLEKENVQETRIEAWCNLEIINWKSATANMKSVYRFTFLRKLLKADCSCNLSPATLLNAVYITAIHCNNEPPKDVKNMLWQQYCILRNQLLGPVEELALVPCLNYYSALGYILSDAPACLAKINFENIDNGSMAEAGISILKVDLLVRTTKNKNQIPVEKYLIDLMVIRENENLSKQILDFLLELECPKTEVWRNVFSHESFGKVILNLFQSDLEKWHSFLQKLEEKKILNENTQLFFNLFNSRDYIDMIAWEDQCQNFFENIVLKEKKIWTEGSKILQTIETFMNAESVTYEIMPMLLNILWTHVSMENNEIKSTMERLTTKTLLALRSNVKYHSLWLRLFHDDIKNGDETKNVYLWKKLLQESLREWLQHDSLDSKPGSLLSPSSSSSSLHFHRKVIQLLSYPYFYELPRTCLEFFIGEVKLQQKKMTIDGDFWSKEDIECVQQCLVQPSVGWALWNHVFAIMINVPILTWEVETKSLISNDIKDDTTSLSSNSRNIGQIIRSDNTHMQEEFLEEKRASQNAHVLETSLAYCFKCILWMDIISENIANVKAFQLFVNFVNDTLSHLFELVKDDTITLATCKFVCTNGNEDKVANLVKLSKPEMELGKQEMKFKELLDKYKQFDTIVNLFERVMSRYFLVEDISKDLVLCCTFSETRRFASFQNMFHNAFDLLKTLEQPMNILDVLIESNVFHKIWNQIKKSCQGDLKVIMEQCVVQAKEKWKALATAVHKKTLSLEHLMWFIDTELITEIDLLFADVDKHGIDTAKRDEI